MNQTNGAQRRCRVNNNQNAYAVARMLGRSSVSSRKNLFVYGIALMLLLILIGIIFIPNRVSASDHSGMKHFKYVTICSGDTLWEYATSNMGEMYSSEAEYIEEVKSINHMEDDHIVSGEMIVLPYYSDVME